MTNRRSPNRTGRHGFTLIELMIVIAALANRAGVVLPLVTTAIDDAKHSTMLADLHAITSAIERYRSDHDGQVPDQVVGRGFPQLTGKTNSSGDLGSGAGYVFGPYIDRLPENPLNGTANVYLVNKAPPANLELRVGWVYHQATGQIWAGLYEGSVPDLGGGSVTLGGGSGGSLSGGYLSRHPL
jgi:prepilin-type N-terminal cleavage/methylation domain-containing protein